MKITAEPRSDQWNADDFLGSPQTFTIAGVKAGSAEQKYDLILEGENRFYRPPLTVLRLFIAAWGDESENWIGQRITLYRDDSVRFGSDAVGGIRVSHMTGLPGNKPFAVKVTSSRGKRSLIKVQPLVEQSPTITAPPVTAERISKSVDVKELRDMWESTNDPELRAQIEARVAEVKGGESA